VLNKFPILLPICSCIKLQRKEMNSRKRTPLYSSTKTTRYWQLLSYCSMSKTQVSCSLTSLRALPCLCMIIKGGSYVNCLGVRDRGTPDLCTLSDCLFVNLSTSNLHSDTASFCGLRISTFFLLCLQVFSSLGHKPPTLLLRPTHFTFPATKRAKTIICLIICIFS
jgi:hypothetical protein